MNLKDDYVKQIRAVAKAYDDETDQTRKGELGAALDALADPLSEGQLKQVVKMVLRN